MVAGVAVAGAVSGMEAILFGRVVVRAGALESQQLDGVDDAESVADGGDAHLLEGVVVELEQDVTSDVVCAERAGVCAAFDVGQPYRDVGVGPGPQKVRKGRRVGWLEAHGGIDASDKAHHDGVHSPGHVVDLDRFALDRGDSARSRRGRCMDTRPSIRLNSFALSPPVAGGHDPAMIILSLLLPLLLSTLALASPYRADLVQYNLNINQNAQDPTQYYTNRSNTSYTPSPQNWRAVPFYTILLDKFADGDPSNNQYFDSMYEWDWRETQLRFGGDVKGLVSKLDYIQGMGIKGIYLSGTIFLNMIWQADSLSFPLSFLLLPLTSPFRLFPRRLQRA